MKTSMWMVGAMALMILSATPALGQTYQFSGTETQLTTNPADQFDPSISGAITAYSDRRGADADIYIYDIAAVTETQITSGGGDQLLSDVCGTKVVYTDYSMGNADVVVYDKSTGQTTRLTDDPANQRNPSIDGNRVVYEDDRNGDWDIYLFDLSSMSETRLTDNPAHQQNAVISGSRVVWEDYRNGMPDIYLFDLDSGTLTQVTADSAQDTDPNIDGDVVVFVSTRLSVGDIYYYRISTGETVAVTNGAAYERNPTVSGDFIAFESLATGKSDIWLYSISIKTAEQVTSDPSNQYLNDLSGNRLVYTDNRNGNLDIYLFEFTFATPEIFVAPLAFDFGEVQVGGSKSTVVTITNTGTFALTVGALTTQAGWDAAFSIASAPTLPAIIPPGITRDVALVFAPGAVGPAATSVLAIASDDFDQPVVQVSLNGTGVPAEADPSELVAGILEFFDDAVAKGSLVGLGPGNSAGGRLKALRNMIRATGDLINAGDYAAACYQIKDALNRTDNLPKPPDFVAGASAPTLAGMIQDLILVLGCAP